MQNAGLLLVGGLQNALLLIAEEEAVPTPPPVFSTETLPIGQPGVAYSVQLAVVGATATWAKVSGSSNIVVSSSGVVSLTAPYANPGALTLTVSATRDGVSASKSYSLVIVNDGQALEDAPIVTTITAVPSNIEMIGEDVADVLITVENQSGEPIANIGGKATVFDGDVATANIIGITDTDGEVTLRITGVGAGTTTVVAVIDGIQSNTISVQISATATISAVQFTESPEQVIVRETAQFYAIPIGTGDFDPGVLWTVHSGAGSIDLNGLYTAPNTVTTATIRATSREDSDVYAEVQITAVEEEVIPDEPDPEAVVTEVSFRRAAKFLADVVGTGNFDTNVSWSVESGGGSIDAEGVYTAPEFVTTAIIRATSIQNTDVFAEVQVNIGVNEVGTSFSAITLFWFGP